MIEGWYSELYPLNQIGMSSVYRQYEGENATL